MRRAEIPAPSTPGIRACRRVDSGFANRPHRWPCLLVELSSSDASPMTTRTIGGRIQMFLRDDLAADLARIAIGNPVELGHQLRRANVRRRILVAAQAK